MDWVLCGNNYKDCFGSANHHMIDQVTRTPAGDRDLDRLLQAHAIYTRLFTRVEGFLEDAAEGAVRFLSGGLSLTVADIPLGVELNRWNLCVAALQRDQQDQVLAGSPVPPLPKLARWYAQLLQSTAFVEAVLEPEAEHQQLEAPAINGLVFWQGVAVTV